MKDYLAVTEHPVERILRVAGGLVALSLVFAGPRTAWGWIGVPLILTGLTGLCPLYTLLGLSSCPRKPGP